MHRRPGLRRILNNAWHNAIGEAYTQRWINSERGLQVYFCREIFRCLADANLRRTVFIEPRVEFSDGTRRHPDIVICNRDKVVAVVELKYGPRGTPSPEKDFNTLLRISRVQSKVSVVNERYRGPTKPKQYGIAANAVLCWAAVSKESSVALPKVNAKRLGTQLLHLQALAHANHAPTILPPL